MRAREALDVLAAQPSESDIVEARAALARVVDVAEQVAAGRVGTWRSALGAALDGRAWPPGRSR